jgi:hypothetical protein
MSAETDHTQHGDRKGADTRWIEVCWECAREWVSYMRGRASEWPTHPDTGLPLPVVLAIKPTRRSAAPGTLELLAPPWS